ncbi:MAG: hypothetical protein MI757_04300, partial [Pirellulales bacterium]|nr:hypothetical protein [Pirellulales bacterium]
MSSASQIPDHIWPLLSQLIDGTLDDAGYADLEAWLIDQPAHQDALLAYCQLHAELGFSQAADDAIEAIRGKAESGERNAEEVLSAEEKDEGGRRKDERRAPDVHSSSFIPHHSLSFFIRNHNFAIAVSVAFVAVAALVGWAAITYLPGVATRDDQDTDTPKPTDFIARLVNENDVEWLHDTKPPVSDPRLWPGRRLAS